ncbi:DUF3883 domain-containing protein [Piscinibacter sp. Jin2]|uniref:DUF3883 domain-containing protein n=1 Tax=Aquariibacter lacus TaxID=2801332 RepID=A0A9X0XGW4_9BURK|nr:DUF3883 domain-containing protein [Piscinibacter lacus]MBL0719743.1 DUF3883 domain-containing protein [Piscinibacter lacus]
MRLTPIPKRELKNVGPAIWRAVDVMEKEFGAQLTHDSGHDGDNGEDATTWIFTFPRHADAQVAVAMNVRKLSMLMRGKTLDGRPFDGVASGLAKFEKRYTNPDKGVASSVLGSRAPYLNPSSTNPLWRVVPATGEISDLLRLYLNTGSATAPVEALAEDAVEPPAAPAPAEPPALDPKGLAGGQRAPVDAETFEALLERRSEVGQAGELLAVQDELSRLAGLGCAEPHRWVERVALVDVGRGYDIASTWPGHERFIEVKSTTSASGGLFITSNERRVLADLGERAWLYRVVLKADGTGEVVIRLQDPMRALPPEAFEPVVFQVGAGALSQAAGV